MYETFFGFRERPFQETARLEFYYPGETIEQARQSLMRAVERGAGPGLIVGPSGTGKTLLCRLLAAHFRSRFDIVVLNCSRLTTRRALLQNLLFELNLPYREMEEGELRLSLIDHLRRTEGVRSGLLLLVDEAHVLPLRLLDEVRMITNLVRDGQPRVRLVVAGGPALEEKFAHPKLESFNQRIAARCYLSSLPRHETEAYVRAQLERAGRRPDEILTADAYRAVFQATDGIPRLINQVADHALLLASLQQLRHISAAGVEQAWADLQQLPSPWRQGPAPKSSSSIIEFGELTDDIEPAGTAVPAAAEAEAPPAPETPSRLLHENLPLREEKSHMLPDAHGENDTPWSFEVSTLCERHQEPDDEIELSGRGTAGSSAVLGPDPFDHDFEEEEVIVCRYSSLEAAAHRSRLTVVSSQSRELADALHQSAAVVRLRAEAEEARRPERAASEPPRAPAVPSEMLCESQSAQYSAPFFDSAVELEPWTWEAWPGEQLPATEAPPAAETAEQIPVRAELEAVAGHVDAHRDEHPGITSLAALRRVLPADDRDMIIVEEEGELLHAAPVPSSEVAHRHEYRQLFARLRQN